MLALIAKKLGELNEQVVYVGGCATGLLITDSLALDIRMTRDVDCIVDILTRSQFHQFEKALREKGFKQSITEAVICRWFYDEFILDVMPTCDAVLSFGNRWYKDALDSAVEHTLLEDIHIKAITAPYFLATKLEAFKNRGNNDYLGSHDFEDIITVIAGRAEIVEEIQVAKKDLQVYLKQSFADIQYDNRFIGSLPGHLNDAFATEQRVQMVKKRIKQISQME